MEQNSQNQIPRLGKGRVSCRNYQRAQPTSQEVTGEINPCDICPHTGDICPPYIRNVGDRRRWFKRRVPKDSEPEASKTTEEPKKKTDDPFVLSEKEKMHGPKHNALVSAFEDKLAQSAPDEESPSPDGMDRNADSSELNNDLTQAMEDAREMVEQFPMAPGRRQRAVTMVVVNAETGSPEVVLARGRLPRCRTLPASHRNRDPSSDDSESSPSPPERRRRGDGSGSGSRKPSDPIDIRSPKSPTAKRQYHIARGMKENKISASGRSHYDPNTKTFTPSSSSPSTSSPAAAKNDKRGGSDKGAEQDEGLMYDISPGGSGDEIRPEDLALLAAFGIM